MNFFTRMSPIRAVRDLRMFLAQREKHELWFLIAALAITGFLIFAFAKDSTVEKTYQPDIIYVQQWRLDRTDAQIKAQQKIDQVVRDKQDAEQKQREAKLRAQFKRLDDNLTRMGI